MQFKLPSLYIGRTAWLLLYRALEDCRPLGASFTVPDGLFAGEFGVFGEAMRILWDNRHEIFKPWLPRRRRPHAHAH